MFDLPKFGNGIGLHRIEYFLRVHKVDRAALARRSIAVTGTNGKGSTSRFITSALEAAGLRVGQPLRGHFRRLDAGAAEDDDGGLHALFLLHELGLLETPAEEAYDALVEIWNGVPWFSPVWCRAPRITFLHHVHGPMWGQMLPGPLAGFGRALEARIAPPFYRRTQMVTPSERAAWSMSGGKGEKGSERSMTALMKAISSA